MRRLAAVLLASVLLAAPALPAHADTVAPSPGTHAFTMSDALVEVHDGPGGKHKATIDTRLYLPDNASAKTPQPAVLQTNGFGLSKTAAEIVSQATFLARHGYVVLTYTAQGFGKSSGCVTLQSRTYDVKDAKQLISKLLDMRADVLHDTHGAVVGTVGGSYGGGIQANLAENDPRVHAIVPGRTWSTLQYSLDPNNRVVPGDPTGFTHELNAQGVFKFEWTSLFFASGNSNPVGGIPPTGVEAGSCPQDKLTSGDPSEVAGLPCLGFYAAVCRTYADVSTTGNATDADKALLADSSGTTQIDQLKVPTLLVQGQSDTLFNENDAVATYLALRRREVPVQMIWNSGGHGGYDSLPGECEVYGSGTGGADFRGLDNCYLSLRTLHFLDHWLRGASDPSPAFTYYRDWVAYAGSGADDEQYGQAAAFPAGPATTYRLAGTSALTTGPAVAGSASFVNPPGGLPPAYSETSNFSGPDSSPRIPLPPTEQPGQHVDFTTPPFTSPLVSVGVPSAHLLLSHAAPTDLVLYGKVYDVAADGSATLIHRLIAPVRVPAAAVSAPVNLKLLGFAHRFAAGHAARLVLASTDTTSYNNKMPDVITVHTGTGSTFTLPGRLDQATVAMRPVTHPAGGPVPPAARSAAGPGASGSRLAATGPSFDLPLAAGGVLALSFAIRRRRAHL